jgi:hypothetical protein
MVDVSIACCSELLSVIWHSFSKTGDKKLLKR